VKFEELKISWENSVSHSRRPPKEKNCISACWEKETPPKVDGTTKITTRKLVSLRDAPKCRELGRGGVEGGLKREALEGSGAERIRDIGGAKV